MHLLQAFSTAIFLMAVQQLTRFQLTLSVARSLCGGRASCCIWTRRLWARFGGWSLEFWEFRTLCNFEVTQCYDCLCFAWGRIMKLHWVLTISCFMVALWNRETIYIFMLWFVMVALCNRADHYIFILFLSSFFFLLLFFSSPNLSGRRLDVYHTLAHGVALVRI